MVANRTFGASSLLDAIRARVADGPCEITLLVLPAAARQAGNSRTAPAGEAWPGVGKRQGENLWLPAHRDYSQAHQTLEYGIDQFSRAGATVNGDVVSSNVIDAVAEAVRGRELDEIIVSTTPTRLARWLHQDFPHRIARKFNIPVTVITPS